MWRQFSLTGRWLAGALWCVTTVAAASADRVVGDTQALGNGTITPFLETSNGAPNAVGLTFTAGALENLPDEVVNLSLPMPAGTPFQHAYVNWNPGGHPPPGIYNVPHFDFHFYTISDAERNSIIGPNLETAATPPHPSLVPAGYVVDEIAVPFMGLHAEDRTSPEFHGQPFTKTMIYGYNAGHLAFIEPMITRDYLLSGAEFDDPIGQPAVYEQAGLYPLRYSLTHDDAAGTYTLSLTGLRVVPEPSAAIMAALAIAGTLFRRPGRR